MTRVPPQLDHIVVAGPDLADAIAYVEHCLGVRLAAGGRHPAWGTRNAILPLSSSTYLEVIGPESPGIKPRLFGIDTLTQPRVVTWAAKAVNLPKLVADAGAYTIDLGEPRAGQRTQPDGTSISWVLTDPFVPRAGGVIPFFIEWTGDAHPGATGSRDVRLVRFHAEHPDATTVAAQLKALNVWFDVVPGKVPRLIAELSAPGRTIRLT